MRRSIVVAVVLLAVAALLVGGPSVLFSPNTSDVAPEGDDEPEIVTLEGSESGFWPYLNGREVHEKRSPLNVIVRGETEEVVRLMSEQGEVDWEEADHDHFEADEITEELFGNVTDGDDHDDEHDGNDTLSVSPTDVPWSQADGTTRLAYLDPGPGEDAYWTTETIQLEDGEYYGYRYHIRLYESPNPEDEWVVMQTHSEHFDWLTLRHRVDGVEAAQLRVERDLMSIPGIDRREDVRRLNLENSGPSDADGWATKVDLTAMAALLVVGLGARRQGLRERAGAEADDHLTDVDRARLAAVRDRIEAGHLLLAGTALAVVLGVRVLGIALDRHVDVLTVHAIAALLYPVLAVGLPVATYLIARGLERRLDAAIAAATSFAVAIWIDYGLVGVDSLPVDVVLQRMLAVVALGLIAGGAAARARRQSAINDMLVVGAALWTLVLVGTLLGYL